MAKITARLSDEVIGKLDNAAHCLHRSRADIIRQAIESYLDDFEDISLSLERLQDPSDETIDWEKAKRALLSTD